MTLEGIIFDWDGVVVNSSDLHEKSWLALASELDLPLPVDHFKKGFGKRNELIIQEILGWTDDCSTVRKWGKKKEEIYRALGNQLGIRTIPGVKPFLQMLSDAEIPCSIGTSTERKNLDLAFEQHGLRSFFRGAICSEDVSKGKPNPEVFVKAASLMNADPVDCIVFEDSLHGIEAALSASMRVVGITTTNSRRSLVEGGAHLVIDTYREITISTLCDLSIEDFVS